MASHRQGWEGGLAQTRPWSLGGACTPGVQTSGLRCMRRHHSAPHTTWFFVLGKGSPGQCTLRPQHSASGAGNWGFNLKARFFFSFFSVKKTRFNMKTSKNLVFSMAIKLISGFRINKCLATP